jgi:hypothetical protein
LEVHLNFDIRGWKEIAASLGCSIRTAQRLENKDNLPVHYERGRVYARFSELDEWKQNHAFIEEQHQALAEKSVLRHSGTVEITDDFRKVFGSDRTIYLIYSELTLNPLVPRIISAYERLLPKRRSSGRHIADRTVRELLKQKPLVTYQPDQRHGRDGYNFRAEHSACVCEVRASAYMASMLSEYKSLSVHVVGTTDGEVYEKQNITFISFGTLINSKTQDLLDDPRALVGFHNGCFVSNRLGRPSAGEGDARPPLHPPVTDKGTEDYGVIMRIEPSLPQKHSGRVWIACAGVQQLGTSGAAFVLANDWPAIASKLENRTGNFVSLIKVKRARKDASAREQWTVECLQDLECHEQPKPHLSSSNLLRRDISGRKT